MSETFKLGSGVNALKNYFLGGSGSSAEILYQGAYLEADGHGGRRVVSGHGPFGSKMSRSIIQRFDGSTSGVTGEGDYHLTV